MRAVYLIERASWWVVTSNGLTMERVFGPFHDEMEACLRLSNPTEKN